MKNNTQKTNEIARKFTDLFVKNFDKNYGEMEKRLKPMLRPERNRAGELLIY